MNTVMQAVALRQKQDQVITWLRSQQADIAMAAATHIKPSAVIRVTQGALRRDEKLALAAVANPQSLLYALLDAARLGHEPDTDDYYLVPFGNEVTGIEGYKGIIERMYRAGAVTSVVAQVVRQKDSWRSRGENTPPDHEFDDFADPQDRGPLKGAYAYALLQGGRCSQVIRMGRAEILRHKAVSKGSDRSDSPWQRWEEAMWKKTVLRALEPYVPTSTEYRDARTGPLPARPVPIEPVTLPAAGNGAAEVVVEAEVVQPESPPAAPQRPRRPGKNELAARDKLQRLTDALPLSPPDTVDQDWLDILGWLAGEPWNATAAQVADATAGLEDWLQRAGGDPEEAVKNLWTAYEAAQGSDRGEPG